MWIVKSKAENQKAFELKAKRSKKILHKGTIFDLHSETIDNKTYESISHPGACAILAIDADDNVYLVKQWRRAAKEILYELPAGLLEKDEKPKDCANREFQEETGYKADQLTPLLTFYSAPGFTNEKIHLFLGQSLTKSSLTADDTEHIDVKKVSLSKALEMINKQQIIDAKTICGLYRYHYLKYSKSSRL